MVTVPCVISLLFVPPLISSEPLPRIFALLLNVFDVIFPEFVKVPLLSVIAIMSCVIEPLFSKEPNDNWNFLRS